MGWTRRQINKFYVAAGLAGWNDKQRYMAMRHAGCPLAVQEPDGTRRPSVIARSNGQREYEMVMSIAEGHCRMNGGSADFPVPNNGKSWAAVASARNAQTVRKIRELWAEAVERLPERFDPAGLDGFVQRMTRRFDSSLTFQAPPETLDDVSDPASLYQILEGLKAWIGREFTRRDMRPRSFTVPASIARRCKAGAA